MCLVPLILTFKPIAKEANMSNGTSRFGFSGFKCLEDYDTTTHAVVEGTIQDGGAVFGLAFIRNKAFADTDIPFVISTVSDEKGQSLWTFKKEDFEGVGLLAKAGESIVIALCGGGKSGAVERVIPLSQLVGGKRLDLRAVIALKRAAAAFLEKKAVFSDTEKKLIDIDAARTREAEELLWAEENEARAADRAERIKMIRARPDIVVYAADGKKFSGTPVTEKEWMSLNKGAYAVIVDSIGAGGKVQGVREWFRVVKEGSRNPKKDGARPVMAQRPESAKALATKPVRTSLVDTKKGAFEVKLFASTDDIRRAATAGLNSGTYVAVNAGDGDEVEVYTLHDGKMKSMGKHILLA
ncbi:hypothetical protein HZC00_02485 [Candidatus Kaiserbacteria bacterium]|nr:hypothetical protein [Candidatus Kaiserbacteria bacterium]